MNGAGVYHHSGLGLSPLPLEVEMQTQVKAEARVGISTSSASARLSDRGQPSVSVCNRLGLHYIQFVTMGVPCLRTSLFQVGDVWNNYSMKHNATAYCHTDLALTHNIAHIVFAMNWTCVTLHTSSHVVCSQLQNCTARAAAELHIMSQVAGVLAFAGGEGGECLSRRGWHTACLQVCIHYYYSCKC